MFGKPAIGNSQQHWGSAASGFEPAGQDPNVRKLGDSRERNPRAPLAQIVQRTQSYKIVLQRGKAQFWCAIQNKITNSYIVEIAL
ncbi:hypothetical protein ABIB73_006443 [Bradyrhizobium sp. F1.4.3]|uniref:hypothetical protein n=1 Tax=Bradyrhizobium sp. F1.4.3 TaxID=3156356 RepID=UPI003397DFB4